MPIYDYKCAECGTQFDEIKGIKAYCEDPTAKCPACAHLCDSKERDFSKSSYQFIGTKVQDAEFNPGLGCVVKNKSQKEDIMKQKGVVEVGNDFNSGQNMQEHFEKRKKAELDSNWDKEPSHFTL